MTKLTTHILDTVSGKPESGVAVELFKLTNDTFEFCSNATSNADGRTDAPLLAGDDFKAGTYELRFHIGDYFVTAGYPLAEPAFLNTVPIRFSIALNTESYHVPLLASPWAYSTYRGS